jgi:preprotein translocase subunit YajC
MKTRCASDGLSYAIDDYTGALTSLIAMPARWWARGMTAAFTPVIYGGRSRCATSCGPQPCADPCHDPCADACAEPCEPCAPVACDPCEPRARSCCACGDPGCSGCGSGKIQEGAEVETISGFVGVVTKVDGRHVEITSGGLHVKVTRKSICKVCAKRPAAGDQVRTTSGFIGTVQGPINDTDRVITIMSGDLLLQIDRKAICEVIPPAPEP